MGPRLRRDPRPHLTRALVLGAALGAVVFLALGLYADLGALADELRGFRWELFPLALAGAAGNYVLRVARWEVYLRRAGIRVPPGRSATIFTAGLAMTVSPGKVGELLKSVLLRRAFAVPVARSAPVVVAERATDALGLALIAVAAGAAGHRLLVAFTIAGTLAVVLALRVPLLDRLPGGRDARASADALLGPAPLVAMTALAAAAWLCECAAALVCLRGLGVDASFRDAVVAFSVATLAGAASFVPGGLGVADASMTALVRGLTDAARAPAVAATVVIRLATLWFGVLVGVVALVVEERISARGATRAAPPLP